ncbi:hypothetical protein GCM10010468_65570 [Actinocorallia longicatena]|uniref:Uncharacterized protein n=1 Tax=Actinocorallia longicatena TaxID=111803 RepID=A0ABP6QMQ0_9ACTN
MLNHVSKTKISGPGAGKPQWADDSKWQLSPDARTTSAITASSFGVKHVVNTLDVLARGYPRTTRKTLFGWIAY